MSAQPGAWAPADVGTSVRRALVGMETGLRLQVCGPTFPQFLPGPGLELNPLYKWENRGPEGQRGCQIGQSCAQDKLLRLPVGVAVSGGQRRTQAREGRWVGLEKAHQHFSVPWLMKAQNWEEGRGSAA